jgi:hypothetical protein
MSEIELLDVVALLEDVPKYHLRRGEVGTAVEQLAPHVWLVEFSNNDGETYALLELATSQMMKLHYEPALIA